MTAISEHGAQRWLGYHFLDNRLVELRTRMLAPRTKWICSWHEAEDSLETQVKRNPNADHFITLNRPRELTSRGRSCTDDNIAQITRFAVDIDPVRPRHQPSTPKQLALAGRRADQIEVRLEELGFQPPARGFSGNGVHLVWRIANPLDLTKVGVSECSRFATLRRDALRALSDQFSDTEIRVDTSVFNAGRVWRLYGTSNHKSWEQTGCAIKTSISIPRDWSPIDPRAIARLAATGTRSTCPSSSRVSLLRINKINYGNGDYRTLDIVRWFGAHGAYGRHVRANIHAVECPWSEEHSLIAAKNAADTVIYEADGGWPGFYCHHDHCRNRTIRDVIAHWHDVDRFCSRQFLPKPRTD